MMGLAVDFGRVYSVASHTQAALDAAALAAARTAQLNSSNPANTASAAATAYFHQTRPLMSSPARCSCSPNSGNTAFTVTATSWVKTPFLSVLYSIANKTASQGAPAGCQANGFGCVGVSSTATAALCPSVRARVLGGGSNVEIAMMLDISGCMCSPCKGPGSPSAQRPDRHRCVDGSKPILFQGGARTLRSSGQRWHHVGPTGPRHGHGERLMQPANIHHRAGRAPYSS